MNTNRTWQQQPTTWKPETTELNILGDWTYQMANPLPAYSGPETPCIKCGYHQAHTTYRQEEPETTYGRRIPQPGPEYLERTCLNCEYTWKEQTIDTNFDLIPPRPEVSETKNQETPHD